MTRRAPWPSAAAAAPALSAAPDVHARAVGGGPTLCVVWQKHSGFDAVGDFDAGRDVGANFRTRPTNLFLVRATYGSSP